ncbi:MAG: hypothetical protein QOF88_2590, partial [Mycobacterium sp.]|nr:hypothetical protein [Mycobacterium sp.]
MGDARYIGRVGALAVALGIGTAVITTPGIAWADGDTDTPSETVNDSTSGDVNNGEGNAPTESHVGNAPTTDDGDPDEQESGGATTISVGGGPEVIISVQANTDDTTKTPPTGDTTPPAPPAPTPPVSTPPVQSSTAPAPPTTPPPVQNAPTEQLPVPTVDPPVDPNPVPGPEQGSDTVTTLHQQPDNSTLTQAQDTPQDTSFANARMFAFATVVDDPPPPAAFTTAQDASLAAAQDPVQALMAFPATVLNIAAGFVAAVLAPFLAP